MQSGHSNYEHNYNSNIAEWRKGVASGNINVTPRNRKNTNLTARVNRSVRLNNNQINKARRILKERNNESARVMKAYYANLEAKRNKRRNTTSGRAPPKINIYKKTRKQRR